MRNEKIAKWCALVSALLIAFTIYRNYTQEKRKAEFLINHQCSRTNILDIGIWYRCDSGLWEEKDIDLLTRN